MRKLKNIIAFVFVLAFSINANAYDKIVAADGTGDYTTVQAAINAMPNNLTVAYSIFVKNGKYREKITVASNKTFIRLIGESVANTIIYYDDPATILGTQNSASFTINATDFSASDITFANTYGEGSQAVAVLVNADRVAFKNCRFIGFQDTLYTKGSGSPRHYFKNCYIDGATDFIFGSSIGVFDSCVIFPKVGGQHLTAANTARSLPYGYVFRDCQIMTNTSGTAPYDLGRPWGNTSATPGVLNKTVYINTKMGSNIKPAGWSTWDANTNTDSIFYAEYKTTYFNGALKDVSQRVAWSHQLTDLEAADYTLANLFGSWDPCTAFITPCTTQNGIAVANFKGVKGASSSQFDWNISWPITGINYKLFRSSDNVSFTEIYNYTAVTDTAVNFAYTDGTLPPAGQKYYYYVQASLSGYATHITDTVIISSKQTITTSSSSMSAFAQELGTPSDTKSYTVSGVNLTGDVTITPPANFEISNNSGATWYTNVAPLVLTPASGVLPNTTILVRLNAAALNSYSGNILHTSPVADDVNVAVSGTTVLVIEKPIVLIHWPLTAAYTNTDSAAARSASVQPSVGRLNNMVVSNGAQIPAYSNLYGQAFNSGVAGTGTWSAGNGGNGSSLNRNYYEEFVIKPVSGQSIRVDSILSNFNFYGAAGTTSNFGYRYGCSWSKTGFKNTPSPVDSVDVISCDSSGVAGAPVTSARKGGFADYLLINSKSDGTGPISKFVFTLASGGVTLNSGDSLTIRLYFSCGSTSAARYGTLKNVLAKGLVLATTPVKLISFTGGISNNKAVISWNTTNENTTKEYFIESSSDGNNFSEIGKLRSNNAVITNNYQYTDSRTLNGNTFYRLRIVDISGKITYSNILKIGTPGKLFNINIYPNPADKEMVISYPKVQNETYVLIKSGDGKTLISQKLQQGTVTASLDISRLVKGIYLVTYSSNGEAITKKLIKR